MNDLKAFVDKFAGTSEVNCAYIRTYIIAGADPGVFDEGRWYQLDM